MGLVEDSCDSLGEFNCPNVSASVTQFAISGLEKMILFSGYQYNNELQVKCPRLQS